MFPNANSASDDELIAFIKGHTALSGSTVNYAVATFRGLVDLADFGEAGSGEGVAASLGADATSSTKMEKGEKEDSRPNLPRSWGAGVTINVNLELSLPESSDPAVYDALFSAMAKHILSNNA